MNEKNQKLNAEEIKNIIIDLAKKGYSASLIGKILKDKYKVYDVKKILRKKIQKFLAEQKLLKPIPEDLFSLMKKAVKIREHLKIHRKDIHSKRGLILTESKIHRLVKYYKRIGKLPKDWKYDPETAKILIEKYS